MKIRILRRHIQDPKLKTGLRANYCPVALALREAGFKDAWMGVIFGSLTRPTKELDARFESKEATEIANAYDRDWKSVKPCVINIPLTKAQIKEYRNAKP